jgi:general secretion pathway protein H
VRALVAALRSARAQAVNRGHPVVFSMNPTEREYKVGEAEARRISRDVKVRMIAAEAATDSNVAKIVFLPGGGSSGGSIDLMRESGEGTRLRVDWLLGRVSHEVLVAQR